MDGLDLALTPLQYMCKIFPQASPPLLQLSDWFDLGLRHLGLLRVLHLLLTACCCSASGASACCGRG